MKKRGIKTVVTSAAPSIVSGSHLDVTSNNTSNILYPNIQRKSSIIYSRPPSDNKNDSSKVEAENAKNNLLSPDSSNSSKREERTSECSTVSDSDNSAITSPLDTPPSSHKNSEIKMGFYLSDDEDSGVPTVRAQSPKMESPKITNDKFDKTGISDAVQILNINSSSDQVHFVKNK